MNRFLTVCKFTPAAHGTDPVKKYQLSSKERGSELMLALRIEARVGELRVKLARRLVIRARGPGKGSNTAEATQIQLSFMA